MIFTSDKLSYASNRIFLKLLTTFKLFIILIYFGTSREYSIIAFIMSITNSSILVISDIVSLIFTRKELNNNSKKFHKYLLNYLPAIQYLVLILGLIAFIICNFKIELLNISTLQLIGLVSLYSFAAYVNIIRTAHSTFYWSSNGIKSFTKKSIRANLFGIVVFLVLLNQTVLSIPISIIFTEIFLIISISRKWNVFYFNKFTLNISIIKRSFLYSRKYVFAFLLNFSAILYAISEQNIATNISLSFVAIISYTNMILSNYDSVIGFQEKAISLVSNKSIGALPKLLRLRSYLIIFLSILCFILAFFIDKTSFNLSNLSSNDISLILYLTAFILPSNLFTIEQSLLYRANINNKKSFLSLIFLLVLLSLIFIYSIFISSYAKLYPLIIYTSIHYLYNFGRFLSESFIFEKNSKYKFLDDNAHS